MMEHVIWIIAGEISGKT